MSAPPGQTGGDYWVGGDGNCVTGDYISNDQFSQLVNRGVAGADEAGGVTTPADIPAADASAGSSFWDSLSTASSSVKGSALDWLSSAGASPAWDAVGEVGLGVGAFEVGWEIGSALDDFLGITSGGSPSGRGPSQEEPAGNRGNGTYGPGATMPVAAGELLPPGGSIGSCGGCNPVSEGVRAPSDGWVINWALTGTNWQSGMQTINAPQGMQTIEVGYGVDANGVRNTTLYSGFVPATITALPGPGQGTQSHSGNCDSVSLGVNGQGCTDWDSGFTPAGETQEKQSIQALLQSPQSDQITERECAHFGASGPCPFWPGVPSPSTGESGASYADQLANDGLQSRIVVLPAPEAEWSTPAGDVQATNPAPGTPVSSGTTVDVYVNPQPMPDPTQTGEKDDPNCDRASPGYVQQSQQTPAGFTAVSDQSLVESSTFNTTLGPTVLNYGYASLINTDPLDFSGWGYWHILAGHGWSLADDADTRLALEDPNPQPGTNEEGIDPHEFYGPKYLGSGGAVCRRVVLVDFGTATGDPGPKGIITSYGENVARSRIGSQ